MIDQERGELERAGLAYVLLRFFLSAVLAAAGVVMFIVGCIKGPDWLILVGLILVGFGSWWQWCTPPSKRL